MRVFLTGMSIMKGFSTLFYKELLRFHKARITDAPTNAKKNSRADSGDNRIKMRLPAILDWIRLDELLAKAFWIMDIIMRPGTRNAT